MVFDFVQCLFGVRSPAGRWVYLVASAFPLFNTFWLAASPYELSLSNGWLWLAVAFLCIVQFSWPTVSGWLLVVGVYAWWASAFVIRQVGAFEDLGSEDHSRWEGWSREWMHLALMVFLIGVAIAAVMNFPKRGRHAT